MNVLAGVDLRFDGAYSCGTRFLRGLLLDIRWDSLIRWEYLHRSVAKLAILLRGGRFLRGLLLDIRWEAVNRSAADIRWDSFSRSVAKLAILLRGTRFLRGLLLDGRSDISTERGQASNSSSREAIPERVAARYPLGISQPERGQAGNSSSREAIPERVAARYPLGPC